MYPRVISRIARARQNLVQNGRNRMEADILLKTSKCKILSRIGRSFMEMTKSQLLKQHSVPLNRYGFDGSKGERE